MKRICLVIVCAAMLLPASVMAQHFTIMTEKLPPFNFEENGDVVGISADLLMLAMEKAGMPIQRADIKLMPWPRAYQTVQETPGAVLFSMARTEQRENLFKWVGPIQDLTIGLIAPKSKGIKINTIEDAKKYKIGSIRDGAPEQLVIQAGIPADALDRIADPALNIKKLAAGRIDMFTFNVPTTFYMMLQAGMNTDDYEVVYTLKKTALYYAFHKDTDQTVIDGLNAAVTALKQPDASGKSPFDGIFETYLGGSGAR